MTDCAVVIKTHPGRFVRVPVKTRTVIMKGGRQGPPGRPGADGAGTAVTDIDGGTANAVYLTDQVIDGGNASGN